MSTQIHPTAVVSPKAEIGDGVVIGPFTVVEADVVIGKGTSIGPHVYCADGARIGENCRIHNGAVVATVPQDLKFKNERTTFEIGDSTTIREFCTLNRGTAEHMKSTVGSNCLLMAYVHVAHDCQIGDNVILANSVQMGGHVTIEDWVVIGGVTAIHQFASIGRHTMVGGHFRVSKDVPPYILAGGDPLTFEGLNVIGLRRRGFSNETLESLTHAYHILYQSKLNVSQGIQKIKEEMKVTPEVQQLLSFVERSERGIITVHSHESKHS
ncbi:MAG TPA: acyl-ACP--UDP-N-acetylglucosamine O-acyltransferase [Bacteroidota bacterium]|nr:acyl-ACP--UDP-N-acetylglucosamine O-acyltransferase [Bacteroidota bacterium]